MLVNACFHAFGRTRGFLQGTQGRDLAGVFAWLEGQQDGAGAHDGHNCQKDISDLHRRSSG